MDFGPDHALQWTGVDRVGLLESIMDKSKLSCPRPLKGTVDHIAS